MNLNKQEIDKFYVSEHDMLLHKFDKENPEKSESQLREINKHKRIFDLRDGEKDVKQPSLLKKIFRVMWK